MSGSDGQNAVMKRYQAPEMLLVFEELRGQTGIREAPLQVSYDRDGKERDRDHVGQNREQEGVEGRSTIHKGPPGKSGIAPDGAEHPGSQFRVSSRSQPLSLGRRCR